MISTFLKSSSHNLKYVGIDGLARIVRINPKYAAEHQLAVIDCLEDPDDMLKKKTLELLYKMTKPNNVEVGDMHNHCSSWTASSGKLVASHHTSPSPHVTVLPICWQHQITLCLRHAHLRAEALQGGLCSNDVLLVCRS